MRIEGTKVIVGVAVGGVDEGFEWADRRATPARVEPFKTVRDWGRTALTALGYLGQAFDVLPEIAAPLAQSQVPLFTKTVIGALRAASGEKTVSHQQESQPRVQHIETQPMFRALSAGAHPESGVAAPVYQGVSVPDYIE